MTLARLSLWAAALLAGCSSRPPAVDGDPGPSYALSVDVPFAELSVPQDSRDGRPPPDDVAVTGLSLVDGKGRLTRYEAPLPVRPRSLFFYSPPDGMSVHDAQNHKLRFGDGPNQWSFTAKTLTIAVPVDAEAPGDLLVHYPFATDREKRLNRRWFDGDDTAFVRARVLADDTSRGGLLLPAPAKAGFDVTVPPSGELHFEPGIVPPETMDGPPSDGAEMIVEVDADGGTTVLWDEVVHDDAFPEVRVDLSRWAGKTVRLRFRTETAGTSAFDYAFFADPVLVARKAHPKRVVLLFVDTLRRDHVGLYGYDRDPTAPLDAWATKDAVVFDDARTVAPWTLPSSRTVLTGKQPEAWESAETLQARLRDQGWATAAFVANVYLSANFDMDRDWGLHHVRNLGVAEDEVDDALDWLDAQDGRDALVMIHFMDCHLPYRDPKPYRVKYAGAEPPGLGDRWGRSEILRARLNRPKDRQYVVDRYDGTIAYVHDQIARVLDQLGPDDTVVYFADHGEEFWDHGGLEHGHSLYDELLRVPLVVRAPGIPAGRVAEPVSLLDVVPTVLDVLGMPTDGLDGTSLVPAMKGDATAKAALAARDQAFGRPLYGYEKWGVLHDGRKYTSAEGEEDVFDLRTDPGEQTADAPDDPAAWRDRMATALRRPVAAGFRIVAARPTRAAQDDTVVELTVPGGVAAAWVGADPTKKSAATVSIDGERVEARWLGGYVGTREVFVVPARPADVVAPELTFTGGGETATIAPDAAVMGKIRVDGRVVTLGRAVAPQPAEGEEAVEGADNEVTGALAALGYLSRDEAPEADRPVTGTVRSIDPARHTLTINVSGVEKTYSTVDAEIGPDVAVGATVDVVAGGDTASSVTLHRR